ncbi:EamA family transporter RarD [Pseudothioglobus sp. nBUS_23]|uniref:EamA family transporter RarD n=1 Tax=Pseudothioglobus sp. nBUS_23 TaxID=3395318 RepID=UPI003EB7AB21
MNKGILLALSGYLMWGCFPIYWALLNHVNPSEVLLHRMLWSVPVLFFLVYSKPSWRLNFKESLSSRKELLFLLITAILITINWGGYILAVNLGRVVEASMGYFLSPVLNMIGGYFFFHERISKLKQLAVLFATVGALFYVFSGDSFPWLGFLVGFTFSAYGIARKAMSSSAVPGLYIETLILLPFFLVFSIWFYSNFDGSFFNIDISTNILLFLAGAVTVVPLALFNAGAKLLPMTTVGILFLITPTLQFLVGYYLQNEAVNSNQLIGFIGVWIGLIMYSYGLIKDK